MLMANKTAEIAPVLETFPTEGALVGVMSYGSGHINDTYAAYYQLDSGDCRRYLLQRINNRIFQDVDGLMSNIVGVTGFLSKKIRERGGDPMRETLNVISTKDGKNYYFDGNGGYWRLYVFIEDTFSLQVVEKAQDMYNTGLSFGNFQKLLADYPAKTLTETIPNFHNTPSRYAAFLDALEKDAFGRAKEMAAEIEFVKSRESDTRVLTDLLRSGRFPLRVTHNDTKLNNILIDKSTGKGLCVIDLDTVMPGLYHYDFGDAIRSGANSAAEDEKDLSRVEMRLDLFEAFAEGYLQSVGNALSTEEKEYLPMGAKLMTFECGIRFLTDYLSGDVYFKTHRPGQNLDRARTQLKLVDDMEKKWEQMKAVISRYS